MSKVRVYELARELGLENKLLIGKAQELGMSSIRSHSNSLSGDEVDSLRRSFIREAIGSRPDSEVVKTSVDEDTGETSQVVERRKGNVIRRRRRSVEEAPAVEAVAEEAVVAEAPVAAVEEPAVAPAAEPAAEEVKPAAAE